MQFNKFFKKKSENVWDDEVAQKVKALLAVEAIDQYWIPGIHGRRRQTAPSSCPVTSALMWCVYNCTWAHTHKERQRQRHTHIHRHTLNRFKGVTMNLDIGRVLLTNVKYLPTGKHVMKDTNYVIMDLFLKSDSFSGAMGWSCKEGF